MNKGLLRNIVVAINGSQSSVQAAMYGIILSRQYSLNMKAVYVVDTATIKFLTSQNFLVSEEKDSYEVQLKADGKTYLDYVENLASSKGLKIEIELREGSVWTEIINAADECEADMILLGGHEPSDKYANGKRTDPYRSVAVTTRNSIVNYARCPVLVIHKPEIEALFKIL